MICSKSSPEGGPHHHLPYPSPGGWGDNLSAPLPKLSLPLQQISFFSLSPFLSPPHSLFAHVAIILQQLISQPGCAQSSPSVFLFPDSVFSSRFIPSSNVHHTSMKMRCLRFRKKTRVKAILNVTNFAHLCVCLQETEHPQQVCSNETGDITSKKKSKCTDTHINSTLFCKAPLHVSSTTIAFLHLNH